MAINNSQRVGFDNERSLAATSFTGSYLPLGYNATPTVAAPLTFNPVVIVFDNQTNVDVPLSVNASTTWKTFQAGEAFVLDLRANHGVAPNYTIDLGTTFYTNAAAGTTGSFRISLVYARNT